MNNKFYTFLGLCMKAGKLVTGSEQALKAVRNNKAVLVMIASDASEGTKKKITDKCTFYEVDYIFIGEKAMLGQSIGKSEKTVLAVTDTGFKNKLIELSE